LGPVAWLNLVALAVFSLSLSMLLFFWVIQRIDVTQASLSIYLLPVFGVILSAITLHEKLTTQLIVGGTLVFVSTFLVTTYEERRKFRAGQVGARVAATEEGSA
jgi:drug/metabolite transporter (DMT)-like permease